MVYSNKPSQRSWVFRRLRSPASTPGARNRRIIWCKRFIVSFRKSIPTGCFLKKARCACRRRLFLLLLNRKSLCKMSFLTKRSLLLLSPPWEVRCLCSLQTKPHKWRRLLIRYNPSPLVLPLHTVLQTEPLRSRLSRCFILTRIILTKNFVELRKFVCFMTTVLSKFLRRRTNECTHCHEVRSLSGYET